jgi:anti-sigma B factor antagonist
LDGSTIVVASGEIDLATSPALRLALLAAAETSSKLVVDLTAVTFLDGAGLRVLLGCFRDLPDGGSMSLVGVNDTVARVLRLTQLDEVFPVHPNAAAAVNGVADG